MSMRTKRRCTHVQKARPKNTINAINEPKTRLGQMRLRQYETVRVAGLHLSEQQNPTPVFLRLRPQDLHALQIQVLDRLRTQSSASPTKSGFNGIPIKAANNIRTETQVDHTANHAKSRKKQRNKSLEANSNSKNADSGVDSGSDSEADTEGDRENEAGSEDDDKVTLVVSEADFDLENMDGAQRRAVFAQTKQRGSPRVDSHEKEGGRVIAGLFETEMDTNIQNVSSSDDSDDSADELRATRGSVTDAFIKLTQNSNAFMRGEHASYQDKASHTHADQQHTRMLIPARHRASAHRHAAHADASHATTQFYVVMANTNTQTPIHVCPQDALHIYVPVPHHAPHLLHCTVVGAQALTEGLGHSGVIHRAIACIEVE